MVAFAGLPRYPGNPPVSRHDFTGALRAFVRRLSRAESLPDLGNGARGQIDFSFRFVCPFLIGLYACGESVPVTHTGGARW